MHGAKPPPLTPLRSVGLSSSRTESKRNYEPTNSRCQRSSLGMAGTQSQGLVSSGLQSLQILRIVQCLPHVQTPRRGLHALLLHLQLERRAMLVMPKLHGNTGERIAPQNVLRM